MKNGPPGFAGAAPGGRRSCLRCLEWAHLIPTSGDCLVAADNGIEASADLPAVGPLSALCAFFRSRNGRTVGAVVDRRQGAARGCARLKHPLA